jgi:hypothetical protein
MRIKDLGTRKSWAVGSGVAIVAACARATASPMFREPA